MNLTTHHTVIKNKLGLQRLSKELGSISQACKIFGDRRDSYHLFTQLYEEKGEAGLQEVSRRKPNYKNRVASEVEEAVIRFATQQPAYGQLRVSHELKKQGVFVSPQGVRYIWLRNGLNTMGKRLEALEAKVTKEGLILTERQLQTLEKKKSLQEAHGEIETLFPGYLGSQDT